MQLKLGDTTVEVIATLGHTPGTLSYLFPVSEDGRRLTVMYAGCPASCTRTKPMSIPSCVTST